VSRSRQVQNLLSGSVNDHRSHLVAGKALVFETRILLDHLIKDFVTLFGDAQSSSFVFFYRFMVLTLKQDSIR